MVNTYRAVSPMAPFGGHGLSGHGREGEIQAALTTQERKRSGYGQATTRFLIRS